MDGIFYYRMEYFRVEIILLVFDVADFYYDKRNILVR